MSSEKIKTIGENLAAIDLGTNSCRLMITDGDGCLLYRDSMATKLGEGLAENKKFSPQAVERGLAAFEKYAKIMQNYQVGRYRAIATASCRMAENGPDFVNEVYEKSNIWLEIVDGVEEARLNLNGARLNADANARFMAVFDLGGGSTEITLATNDVHPEIIHTVSIPWGGRNSAEAFALEEFDLQRQQKLAAEIKKYTKTFVVQSGLNKYRDDCCLLATSSTPLRLISMVKEWGIYERSKGDGVCVTTAQLDDVIDQIYKMSLAQRTESPYIGENRAPIFIAACTIFKTIYDELGFNKLTASLKSAQDGMIEELIYNGKTDAFCKNCSGQKKFNRSGQDH